MLILVNFVLIKKKLLGQYFNQLTHEKNRVFDNALPTIVITTPRSSILPLGPIQREFLSGTRFIKSWCAGRYIYSHEMFIYYLYLTITSLAGNLFFKPNRYM